jgi:phosphinothricin acetyltransferase
MRDPAPDPGPAPAPVVRVRLATPDDGAACAAVYRPYVLETAISFETQPPDGSEMARRIARTLERTAWVVAEVDGTVRAYAYASRFRERPAYDWTAETTVYVDRGFARLGLGRATMTTLLDILRLQGFHTAVAGVTPPNPGSVALHVALGFERIGTFQAVGWKQGGWHGVEFFALELSPQEPEPLPIRPLAEAAAAWLAGAADKADEADGADTA